MPPPQRGVTATDLLGSIRAQRACVSLLVIPMATAQIQFKYKFSKLSYCNDNYSVFQQNSYFILTSVL